MFEAPVFNPLRFCRASEQLEGRVAPGEIQELQDVLYDRAGEIIYRVSGGADAQHRPVLALQISGWLNLICQRCLEAVAYPVKIESHLVMVEASAALPALDQEQEGWDVIVRPERVQVADLITEEILLALPVAPLHGDEARCYRI